MKKREYERIIDQFADLCRDLQEQNAAVLGELAEAYGYDDPAVRPLREALETCESEKASLKHTLEQHVATIKQLEGERDKLQSIIDAARLPPPRLEALEEQNAVLLGEVADLDDGLNRSNAMYGELLVKWHDACDLRDRALATGCEQVTALWKQNAALLGQVAELTAALDAVQVARDATLTEVTPTVITATLPPAVTRTRLPDNRVGTTFKLRVGAEERLCPECSAPLPGSRVSGHLTVNRYPDGRPGELFLALDRARRGDLAATFAHQFAIVVSMALQYGVPLATITARLRHVRDDSGGVVMHEVDGKLVPAENPRTVGSLVDLIAVTLERCDTP